VIPIYWYLTQPFTCCGVLCSAFVFYGTKCSSRVGERQGQLAGAVGGQAGAVVLRKETTLWDSRVAVGRVKEFAMEWAAEGPGVVVWMLEQG